MHRTIALIAFALVFLPQAAASQLVIRDDVDGWGWLAMMRDRRAIVQLAYASPNDEQGRLDAELLEQMRGRGVRRIFGQDAFQAAESQVLAECTGTNWTPEGSTQVQIAIHAEVSYWDHTRLAATEIWEALTVGATPQEQFSNDAYVEGCSRALGAVLVRLGFDQG
ncbi:MAG: hypothetical protein AB7T31_01020 [Gemmatimonadales bacterium]